MTEIIATLTTIVGLGLQLKDSINRVKYNQESHRLIVDRISDSLRRLKLEAGRISMRTSPGLAKSIAKLKSELQHALEKCQKAPLTKNTSGIRQWFHRDGIESLLKDVEKHIASCFHEFTALTAVRIERKLGDHNVQVNRKLDELLRRSDRAHPQVPASPRSNAYYTQNITKDRTGVQGRYGTSTLKARLATDRGRGSLDLPRTRDIPTRGFVKPPTSVGSSATRDSSMEDLTFNVHLQTKNPNRRVVKRKPPPVIRSDTTSTSITSASSVSLPSLSSPPSSVTNVPTVSFGMARAAGPGDRTHIRALSNPVLPTTLENVTTSPRSVAGAIRIPPSPTSPNFSSSSSPNLATFPATFASSMEHVNLFSQAHDYDTECRRLRSLQHHNEALIAARNAVALRRTILSMNRDYKNVTALARSLMYVGRCLRDLLVDSRVSSSPTKQSPRKGENYEAERRKAGSELVKIWEECVELYREAFREDKSLRVELATVLYNLSAKLSEPTHGELPSSSIQTTAMTSMTSLNSRDAALSRKRVHELDLETALDGAEEAVHHFTVLECENPEISSMDLANAQLNLSFILSDLGRSDKALAIARKAVILSYRLTSADPHTQERVRIIRTLHKSLMRVSFCLKDLGKKEEAMEAQMEADDVLKKPFFVSGS
ncbi:hypothetical protein K435DRAFT_969691 [Dendrothele bispora CBS 962.96]|uniref:Fungal N-terminal domain-containing protein n=1 Tax=Dendrothele bispora (strain CBS 962.96) TaxID=1314807 RepID=A0A4V4HDP9_DENBC|nr:hypothetical protein K435DRAFT_969691 [Dendrothele bispora CBS 962.96]